MWSRGGMRKIFQTLMVLTATLGVRALCAQDSQMIYIGGPTGFNFRFTQGPDGAPTPNSPGVSLGTAGSFSILALGGSIDDSGPTGPDASPHTVAGNVGVVTSGQKFQASGSVTYGGSVYLHSGVTYNSSANGVPQPTMNASVDSMLNQAKTDALNASAAATALGQNPTASYGTINSSLSITEANAGNFVFDITGVNFSGGKILTLSAPAGSTYILNITSALVLTGGSIVVAGGLTAGDVLINYTGTADVRFSGGGNSSRVYGTILAPNAAVKISPGYVGGAVIADSVTMSSGANVVPEAPTTALLLFGGLLAAGVRLRFRGARSR